METCIFCKVVAGEIPAVKVYEDDATLAFLDIHPVNEGHTLVIPKKHEPEFQNMGDLEYGNVFAVVRRIAQALRRTTAAKRIGLAVVGFDVPHAHVHVIPLHNTDDITSEKKLNHTLGNPTWDERVLVAQKLQAHL